MNFAHIRWFACLGQKVVMGLVVALLLAVAAQSVAAQGPPPNLDFGDGSGGARYNSTGRAFVGAVTGNINGTVRNGAMRTLDITFDPDVNGPRGLRLLRIDYSASSNVIPPSVQWYVAGTTRRLVITNVPARQYFSGTGIYSKGFAKVEITFDGGAGKAVVSYTHSVYSTSYSGTPLYYNGTVFSGSPLAGRRLSYTLR